MIFGTLLRSAVLSAALWAAPAAAELLPEPHAIVTVEEKDELRALGEIMSRPVESPAQFAESLDPLLTRLSQPTKFRGFVQFLRASAMSDAGNDAGAREPIAESIRLLPGYSGPLLVAMNIHAFVDEPAPAADYLLRAAAIDPAAVGDLPEYELSNLVRRLVARRERTRLALVAERLIAIGWQGSMPIRSELARYAIEERMKAGRVEEARALVPKLLVPTDARRLLIQRRYERLWPAIEAWAGPRFERLWPAYLQEARARWQASRDPDLAPAYASALLAAGHHKTLVRELLPLFSGSLDADRDWQLVFIVTSLATALAREERWDEIDPLFERALRVWPTSEGANALNLTGNRAVRHLFRGDAEAAIVGLDATLAEASRWGGQVSTGALSSIHFYRACALHKAGRTEQAFASRAFVARVGALFEQIELELCLGDQAAARRVLLAAFSDDQLVPEALLIMQAVSDRLIRSAPTLRIFEGRAALRADPELRAAAGRVGRILPYPVSAGAPVEAKEPEARSL